MKSIIELVLPLFLLFIFSIFVIVYSDHSRASSTAFLLIGVAFVITIFFEIIFFKKKIVEKIDNAEKIQKILDAQQKSATLLVRRDLELTRANEKLRELDDRKSEFVSVVAHQLRTPLSGIKWTLNMLLNGDLGEVANEQKVFVMKAYESNERMINLVDDMLGADRIDSGKFHYSYTSTQLYDLLDNVLYELLPLAAKKNLVIEFEDRSPIPKILIDQEKMRAVFQNLLENAIKYTLPSGAIKLRLRDEKDHVEVSVKDSGIGIPEDQQKNIFNRFFRARNALKVETDGSGLGLFIVRSIIEKHGGKIWFESIEGKGSTFYFTLKK